MIMQQVSAATRLSKKYTLQNIVSHDCPQTVLIGSRTIRLFVHLAASSVTSGRRVAVTLQGVNKWGWKKTILDIQVTKVTVVTENGEIWPCDCQSGCQTAHRNTWIIRSNTLPFPQRPSHLIFNSIATVWKPQNQKKHTVCAATEWNIIHWLDPSVRWRQSAGGTAGQETFSNTAASDW